MSIQQLFHFTAIGIATLLLVSCDGCAGENAASDAGPDASCEIPPLAEFCADSDCPPTLPHATVRWCDDEIASAVRSLNSCDGTNVTVDSEFGALTYQFDADQELVGVRAASLPHADCSARNPEAQWVVYGRICESGDVRGELRCDVCSRCVRDTVLRIDWPYDFEAARMTLLTACRNDECVAGMLPSNATAPPLVPSASFAAPPPAEQEEGEPYVIVRWTLDEANAYDLEVEWFGSPVDDFRDGDQYRLIAERGGVAEVLLDQVVSYENTHASDPEPCPRWCPRLHLDRTTLDESDAGAEPEDAAP